MRRELIFTLALSVLIGAATAPARHAQTTRRSGKQPPAKKTAAAQTGAKSAQNAPASKPARKSATAQQKGAAAAKPVAAQSDFEALLKLPPAEQLTRLQALLATNPPAALRARAIEHLVVAHAALADGRLRAGDAAGGVAEFKEALALVPADMSDKFFFEVVSQFPANLFLRGQHEAAGEIARLIEAKVQTNPQRLLALASFYLNVEQPDEAARLATTARTLAPELAAVHQALGGAYRLSLRLDEATAEYKRALELDPKSALSRRTLADLLRASGKPEDALALYREQLTNEPNDRLAQAGVVLSLLDAQKREEAERELAAALKDEPRNLPLLVGAAYWFAAHDDAARAVELAGRAVEIEPRYTWAQIALARALIAGRRAPDAERALRFAREYGRFPTLDYELANALAASGLYEEAAEELAHTFTLKDGQLETRLAGRVPVRADNFPELLAPERRASIFQATAADTDANARNLKGLLALYLALNAGSADDAALANAARDFTAGDDSLRAFRQLYAADRLARRGVALSTARELAEAAKGGVEAAANTPVASVAVAADELRPIRARAINAGGTPDFPIASHDTLLKLMRGRTEELIGWALYEEGKAGEAVQALRRAVSVLPPESLYWRNAQWRLGTALAANGQTQEALNAYVKGYDRLVPDPARRAVIEALYTKVKGSTDGLDALIGPTLVGNTTPAPAATPTATPDAATTTPAPAPTNEPPTSETPAPSPTATPPPDETPTPTPAQKPVEQVIPASAAPTPTPPEATQTPTPEPVATQTPAPVTGASPTAPQPTADEKSPAPIAQKKTEAQPARARARSTPRSPNCTLTLSVESLLLSSGGSSTLTASLAGQTRGADITTSTRDWADIIILRAPQDDANAPAQYTITSTSKKTGTFIAVFKSPCGTKEVAVTIK